jgi:hypothetical protein
LKRYPSMNVWQSQKKSKSIWDEGPPGAHNVSLDELLRRSGFISIEFAGQ